MKKKVERKERSEWEEKKKLKKWWTFIGPDWIHQFCFISAGAFYFNAVVSPTDPQVHLVGIVTN